MALKLDLTPKRMFDEAITDFLFKTIIETEEMYYFDMLSGIWRLNGDKLVRTALRRRFEDISGNEEREVIRYVQDTTFVPSEHFKQDKEWLALKKGEIFIKTGKYEEGFDPKHNIQSKFNVYYHQGERCPNFMKFLKEILPDPQSRVTVLECLASVLVPDVHLEKAYMFIGGGANGKSTLLSVFKALLDPDSYCAISIQDLIYSRFSPAELDGKIANVYPDINTRSIKDLGRFKLIVSGEKITVERKGRDPRPMVPTAKHFFASNQPPKIDEDTDAVFRRFVLITFPVSFIENRKTDLITELLLEKPGIFNLLLHTARALRIRGKFLFEQSVQEMRVYWRDESDPIAKFLNEKSNIVKKDIEGKIPGSILYNRYVKFCREKKFTIKLQTEFTKAVKANGIEQYRTSKERGFMGISLVEVQDKLVDEKSRDME